MQVLAEETGGRSYKAHKYGLDHAERPVIDYSEDAVVWEKMAETSHNLPKYISLKKNMTECGEQYLTYFLDGSRRVYKVDDHSYFVSKNGRSRIFPIIAGQIGVGCCKRVDRIVTPEQFHREIVISVPDIANADGKAGFFEGMAIKLSNLPVIKRSGIKINSVIPYDTSGKSDKFENRGTARIQDRMVQCEKDMVAELVKKRLLNSRNYLIKDGSLEYRPTDDIKKDVRKLAMFKNGFNYVLGVSKNFNPEVCKDIDGKANPGYISELPLYHRTQVAYYSNPDWFGDIKFAMWYIRLRDSSRTRTTFDGIVKVEKMLVTQEENEKGIDSDLVNMLSALIIKECFNV